VRAVSIITARIWSFCEGDDGCATSES